MSTVVFCEGKHDVDFLSLIHQRHFGKNYDTFIQQESKDSQDTRVRQHKIDEDIEYLYKAEGGRSEVIKKFRSHATEFGDYNLILLVDLDGGDILEFKREMHTKLEEHYGDALQIEPNQVTENSHIEVYICDVLINDSHDDQFTLISFKQSLESVTYIRDKEDRSKRLRKINYYLENCSDVVGDITVTIY